MKVWQVDDYKISPTKGIYYGTTSETLAYILNNYEKAGATVKEICESTKGNFRIIYTIENLEDFKNKFCK